ncbi:lysine exporter LysO family protein [Alicyclobacillus ferrooxydans]|uniref:lysine exporter LysO family protein n=1 Tax=Alicyclobacillus ferrooxydans TaxID=471514 RepID=UPI0006D5AD3F|nr:lysine exporter LysO family protein [Alicyclobacillus ferrooxydans]
MWWFVLTFIGGLAVGRRNWLPTALLRRTHWLVSSCLAVLVFVLGYDLGSNRHLVAALPVLGYRACIIAVLSMAGSVLFGMLTARWLWQDSADTHQVQSVDPVANLEADPPVTPRVTAAILRLPGLIIGMLIIGALLGFRTDGSIRIPNGWQNAVFALMLLGIGLEIGTDPRFWTHIQKASWRMFIFPVNAVFGSLLGGLLATVLVHGRLLDNLAAAAGLGWYSLAAVLVNQLSGPESGTIAFLSNVIREVLGFLAIPLLNRWMWTPGAIALGAATTMDTTLPLFRRAGASTAGVVYAFVNGVLVSALVPLLIPLVLKL